MSLLLFLDIETTGFNPEDCELLELAAIRFDGEKDVATFDELICPENDDFEIPPIVERITGITPDMVENAPSLKKVKEKFLNEFLKEDDIIVGHNISFDTGFLRAKSFDFPNAEIDTYPLSTIILPDEESHSLEILTEKYGLPHDNAHRALADVIANRELWKLLLWKFQNEFPASLQSEYQKILAKSSWSGKSFFSSSLSTSFSPQKTPEKETNRKNSHEAGSSEEKFRNKVQSAFAEKKKVLWEVYPAFPMNPLFAAIQGACAFSKAHNQKVGIGYHRFRERQIRSLIPQFREEFPGLSFDFFRKPDVILCETKWTRFLEKKQLADLETIAALKVLRDAEDMNFAAPNLKHEEWSVWPEISDTYHDTCPDTCPGKKALPENVLSEGDVFFFPHTHVSAFPGDNILIEGAENLDEILTGFAELSSSSRKVRSLCTHLYPVLAERICFTFDLLGAFLRKQKDESPYQIHIAAHGHITSQKDWPEFCQHFEDLLSEVRASFPEERRLLDELTIWSDFFSEEGVENEIRFFSLFPDDEVACFRDPICLHKAFASLTEKSQSCVLIGSHFPKNKKKEWSFMAPVPQDVETETLSFPPDDFDQRITVFSPSKLTSADNTPRVNAHWLRELAIHAPGNVLAVFSSQKNIEAVDDFIMKDLLEHQIHFLSHRNGSIGKIARFLREKPGKKLLCGTQALLEKLLPIDGIQFSGIFVQKFFFDPPGNELVNARKKFFSNAFEGFALPRSLNRFEREVYRLARLQSDSFFFFCCDPRLNDKKGFGKNYQYVLPPEVNVRTIALGDISELFC